ncbi:hypothetical protein B0T16DRAFT_20766 [Cercophora newfieldiana]|uniref:Uncharacterized protein n=1 Tax=Cercophora newfieldiana TaxID=92897 RepID=A0AA39YNR5_9PEZI|nr:hypothetical protein B0T16DRAFT_20766 [Cercophora newfieldiana]
MTTTLSLLFPLPFSPVTISFPVPITVSSVVVLVDTVLAMCPAAIIALLFFVLELFWLLRLPPVFLRAAFWGVVSISMSPDSLKYAKSKQKETKELASTAWPWRHRSRNRMSDTAQ